MYSQLRRKLLHILSPLLATAHYLLRSAPRVTLLSTAAESAAANVLKISEPGARALFDDIQCPAPKYNTAGNSPTPLLSAPSPPHSPCLLRRLLYLEARCARGGKRIHVVMTAGPMYR